MNARPLPDSVCACSLISSADSIWQSMFVWIEFGITGLQVK